MNELKTNDLVSAFYEYDDEFFKVEGFILPASEHYENSVILKVTHGLPSEVLKTLNGRICVSKDMISEKESVLNELN